MTKTIILSPRFSSDSQDIWRAAVRKGWDIHRAICYKAPETTDCCVYGELITCDIMADRCGLALLDPPDFFLSELPYEYVKRDITCCTKLVFNRVFRSDFKTKLFVKPANDKVFTYGIYYKKGDVPLQNIADDCPIIVSSVVDFETEVRLYCLDNKVLTLDHYRFIGDRDEQNELNEAKQFGQEVLDKYGNMLPSAVVLDVGRISDGSDWAVIETNQAYSSGIYGTADCDAILDITYRAAGPSINVSENDKKFIRKHNT